MEPQIVHPSSRYAPAALLEPSASGYLHLAAEVNPRRVRARSFGAARSASSWRASASSQRFERVATVERVTVLEAVAIPPLSRFPYVREHAGEIRLPRLDVARRVALRMRDHRHQSRWPAGSPAWATPLEKTLST